MTSTMERVAVPQPVAKRWFDRVLVPEMWATASIVMMWLAVLFVGIYGSDFVSMNGSGTNVTRLPSVVFVAFFAFLATAAIAKQLFGRRHE